METNPFVEPDAPLPPDEVTPQSTPTNNPPPEPATPPVSEIATETAAAEALPEPLVEVAEQAAQPEPAESSNLSESSEQPTAAVSPEAELQPEQAQEVVAESYAETVVESSTEASVDSPETGIKEDEGRESQAELLLELQLRSNEPQSRTETPQSESAEKPGEVVSESEAPQEAAPESSEPPVETQNPVAEGEVSATEPPAEGAEDPLAALANHAQTTRLSPADEERATTLLKEALLDGRAGVVRAVAALPKLPWVIGVNAVTAVWPELKPAFRSQLLAGLVRTDGDQAKRIRLSLARGLFKQDVPIAQKIVVGASREMRNRETGAMSPKHAQIFANVLIGRAKPWIAQLPLADLKPNDADVLVHCALLSAFSLPHAPITQLGIIKWAAEAGRLGKVHQIVIDAAQKSLGRWSGKWQNVLRKEVAELPEGFAAALKAHSPKDTTQAPPEGEAAQETAETKPAVEEEEKEGEAESVSIEPDAETEAAEVTTEGLREEGEEPDAEDAEVAKEEEEDEDEGEDEEEEETSEERQRQPKPRPVYESKTVPRKPQQGQPQPQPQPQPQQAGKGGATLKEATVPELLRQLESQFQSLRSELHNTQGKLRQRDEDLRRAQKKTSERASAPVIEGEPTPEELARLNRQLESRNQELQARIEELLADSEARAVSVGAVSGEPVIDPNTQLRTLLGLKIQEDYEDFLALEKESPDIVVQQYYRTVLRHVFEVLTQEGIHFEIPKSEVM